MDILTLFKENKIIVISIIGIVIGIIIWFLFFNKSSEETEEEFSVGNQDLSNMKMLTVNATGGITSIDVNSFVTAIASDSTFLNALAANSAFMSAITGNAAITSRLLPTGVSSSDVSNAITSVTKLTSVPTSGAYAFRLNYGTGTGDYINVRNLSFN